MNRWKRAAVAAVAVVLLAVTLGACDNAQVSGNLAHWRRDGGGATVVYVEVTDSAARYRPYINNSVASWSFGTTTVNMYHTYKCVAGTNCIVIAEAGNIGCTSRTYRTERGPSNGGTDIGIVSAFIALHVDCMTLADAQAEVCYSIGIALGLERDPDGSRAPCASGGPSERDFQLASILHAHSDPRVPEAPPGQWPA